MNAKQMENFVRHMSLVGSRKNHTPNADDNKYDARVREDGEKKNAALNCHTRDN